MNAAITVSTPVERQAHDAIAKSYCRVFGALGCPCSNDPTRCHASTIYLHEAAAAVLALKRRGLLRDDHPARPGIPGCG